MVDRIFGWLMVAAALLHSYGCLQIYRGKPELLLWSLTAGLAELYLGSMNLVRAERRHDLVLSRLCVAGNLAWLIVTAAFATMTGHWIDARVLVQLAITAVLLGMSMRARRRSRPL